jgi:DNA-binding transcriptional LysR family regulator
MEARLATPLLLRTTRSVTLAPSAQAYFERCLDVLDAVTRAQAALDMQHPQRGLLRVAMPVDLGVELLGPLIARYTDTHPGLQVEMDLSSRAVDLLREPVDLAFRIGRTLDDRVVARRIGDIASGLYAAPELLRRLPPIADAGRLETVPCLDLRTAQGSMPWQVGASEWAAAPGPCVLSANSVALLRALAEQGRGVALLACHVAAAGVQSKRLVRVLPGEPTPTWPLYALTARRTVPEPVRGLIAHVRQALSASAVSVVAAAQTRHLSSST